jgi:hypothetical protein
MKNTHRHLGVLLSLLLASCSAFAQFSSGTAKRVIQGTPKPTTCAVGDVWTDTTASPAVMYNCLTPNTWTAMGGGSGITNSAGNNVVTKSNGTNIVASSITDDGTTISTAEPISLTGSSLLTFTEAGAPAAPAATQWDLYFKTTTGLCEKNSAGTETCLVNPTLDAIGSPVANTAWTVPNANNITVTSGTATTTVDTFTVKAGTNNTGTGVLLRVNGNTGDASTTGLQIPFQVDIPGLNGAVSVNKFGQLFTTAIVSLGSLTISQQGGGGGLINLQSTSSSAVGILATTHHSATGGGFLFDSFNDQTATTTVPANSTPFCGRAQWFRTSDSSLQTNRWCFQTVMGTTANNPTSTLTLTNTDTGATTGASLLDLSAAPTTRLSTLRLGNTTAGAIAYAQGTSNTGATPCTVATSICEQAPTGVTSYLVTKPGVSAQGSITGTLSGTTITQGFSGDTNHSATVTIGSGTSIGSTSLCSTTFCPVGTYRVNVYVDITTACGTSGTYIVNLIYTDDQGSKTIPVNINGTGSVPATGTLTTTSTNNFGEDTQIIRSTGAASINYSTTATACGTAGPMVGKLYLSVEPVQ